MLRFLILIISVSTAISGAVQCAAPGLVLGLIGGDDAAANLHSFRIVGMFMFLFGCMMVHALYDNADNQVAILWSALQKLGAFIAVTAGVCLHLFAPIALGVAFFDLFSSVLFFSYLLVLRRQATRS